MLEVHTLTWQKNWDIVIKGKRIAWTGPSGQWTGEAVKRVDAKGLYAVPGFGESHKHIESSHLTAGIRGRLGNTLRQYLDGGRLPRIFQRQRRAQCRVLADPEGTRQPLEDFSRTGLGHPADTLRNRRRATTATPKSEKTWPATPGSSDWGKSWTGPGSGTPGWTVRTGFGRSFKRPGMPTESSRGTGPV